MGLVIHDNVALLSLSGLNNLVSVDGVIGLSISQSPSLTNMEGLDNLTSVGSLYLYMNSGLSSLDGLDSLASVGEVDGLADLQVRSNENLPQCEVCELVAQLTQFSGDFSAVNNLEDECSENCL